MQPHHDDSERAIGYLEGRLQGFDATIAGLARRIEMFQSELTSLRSEIMELRRSNGKSHWRERAGLAGSSSVLTGSVILGLIKLLEMVG